MSILGIDYGEKRIGISISDVKQIISFPQEPITSRGIHQDSITISKLVEEKQITMIVIGLPLTLSGVFGYQAKIISEFEMALKNQTTKPIITFDERLSTKQAINELKQFKKAKPNIDSVAACLMLQTFLDSKRLGAN